MATTTDATESSAMRFTPLLSALTLAVCAGTVHAANPEPLSSTTYRWRWPTR